MLLLTLPALGAELQRKPYLQGTTPTSSIVVWRTEEMSFGEVRYGTDPEQLIRVATDGKLTTHHEVTLPDLEPGVRTWYAVFDGKGEQLAGGEKFFVETVPSDQEQLRIWVVGDSGTGLPFQTETRDAMLDVTDADRPDIFLHMGDMAYSSGTTQEFDDHFYSIYSSILRNTTVWPTIGNHEGQTSDSRGQRGPYYDGYVLPSGGEAGGVASGTEAYYAFDVGLVHFVVLDSHGSDRREESAMIRWLKEDLAANDQPWLISFWHHPPYTDGSHNSDTERTHMEMRETVVPLLEAAGVDLVLGGHSHIYERSYLLTGSYETPSTAQGILDRGDGRPGSDGPYEKFDDEGALYVVAGHGGTGNSGRANHPVMAFEDLMNGSVILDITPERLTIRNIRMNRTLSDEVVLLKDETVVLVDPDGDQNVLAGRSRPIRWWSPGDAPVDIEWTCDGDTWETLAEGVTGGRLGWTVPEVRTTEARVRVVGADSSDTSDGRFRIRKMGSLTFPYGSHWRVWDEVDWPGPTWMEEDFDDGDWPVGRAEIGVGDGDESHQLHARSEDRTSVYFRRKVDISGTVTSAWSTAIYDDGIAMFVNGHLVDTTNLIDLKHESWAEDEDWDNSAEDVIVDPRLFHQGENTIAVVVKNHEGSADTSFDLQLHVDLEDPDMTLVECGYEAPLPPDDEGCSSVTGGRRSPVWLLPLLLLAGVRRWR